ncbi:MAG: hypothetical protein KZQ76_01195 [Candidatus Thiodiazotropha sp. (ex Epidulcina cf. delphinae)]|nr:hypothetical protein [Candidatus Thiodiazotropha sp. (ex Epidulcina cf. delphinae)]
MALKEVDLETLQQHVDALNIIVNLLLTEMSESNPDSLNRLLQQLRKIIDTSPQLHPTLTYMTFRELIDGGSRH